MSGVIRKLKEQAPVFNALGVVMVVFNDELDGLYDDIHFVKFDDYVPSFVLKIFRSIYIRTFKYKLLESFLLGRNVSRLIVRYSYSDFSIFSLVRKFSGVVIFEHHTKELEELECNNKFRGFLWGQFIMEKYAPRLISRHLKGCIAVTEDILIYQVSRFGLDPNKSHVFPNGVKRSVFVENRKKKIDDVFEIVFGASRFSHWHGLDLLIESANQYKGAHTIHLNIFGDTCEQSIKNSLESLDNHRVKLFVHGTISRDEIFKLYERCHLGVDSLGLNRLGMTSGSTLKSKEYIARGLPFIYNTPDQSLFWANDILFYSDGTPCLESAISHYETLGEEDFKYLYRKGMESSSWEAIIEKLISSIN